MQVRQKTQQRKTLFYVEQLLIKYGATKVSHLVTSFELANTEILFIDESFYFKTEAIDKK